MRNFAIVAAFDDELGIGRDGTLPWHIPDDMAYFSRLTTDVPDGKFNAMIVGRKTYESAPALRGPLTRRMSVVLTSRGLIPGAVTSPSLHAALQTLSDVEDVHKVFVIGGQDVFAEAIHHPLCQAIYATHVYGRFDCDRHFPEFPWYYRQSSFDFPREGGQHHYAVYRRMAI